MHIFNLKTKQAFTLIELLIVIGILGILIVTVLVLLNPAETQRKARDLRRIKDIQTLQAIVSQYMAANPTGPAGGGSCFGAVCGSEGATTTTSEPCASNWLGINVCEFAQSVPVDPLNGANATVISVDSGGVVTTSSQVMRYKLTVSGSEYEINARQESTASKDRVSSDSGNADGWVEVGSDLTLIDNTP